MEIVTLDYHGKPYRIYNPGEGRIGSKLSMGTAYELMLLEDVYDLGLTGSVFDVGAHIGNHTLFFGAVCGFKVYAWEPHDGSLKQLYDNLGLNPQLEVEVFEWAAGNRDTHGRLSKGMWMEFDPSREGATMKLERGDIPVHRIDDLLTVADLAVVKIDVEGMEPEVLEGMTEHLKRCRPVVYCETHTRLAQERIRRVLEPLGYHREKILRMGSPQHRWDP